MRGGESPLDDTDGALPPGPYRSPPRDASVSEVVWDSAASNFSFRSSATTLKCSSNFCTTSGAAFVPLVRSNGCLGRVLRCSCALVGRGSGDCSAAIAARCRSEVMELLRYPWRLAPMSSSMKSLPLRPEEIVGNRPDSRRCCEAERLVASWSLGSWMERLSSGRAIVLLDLLDRPCNDLLKPDPDVDLCMPRVAKDAKGSATGATLDDDDSSIDGAEPPPIPRCRCASPSSLLSLFF